MRSIIVSLFVMFLLGCGSAGQKNEAPMEAVSPEAPERAKHNHEHNEKLKHEFDHAAKKAAIEERLMSTFVEFPATQEAKDNNKIIEFAIANEMDLTKTESGLYYWMYPVGNGRKLVLGDAIKVQYTGYFLDGKIFESSLYNGGPAPLSVGSTIKGWTEMLLMMRMGDKGKVVIPSHLAYGSTGQGEKIPPDTPLFFDIEVMSFVKG